LIQWELENSPFNPGFVVIQHGFILSGRPSKRRSEDWFRGRSCSERDPWYVKLRPDGSMVRDEYPRFAAIRTALYEL
jgi:hypothetical protein